MVEELLCSRNIQEDIVAQIGYSKYCPKGIKCIDFLSEEEYQNYISEARIIISHAGTGALFSSIKKGKKVIAVARLKKYGEMINDHQLEIVKKLSKDGYILDGTNSIITAWDKIDRFVPKQCDFKNALPEVIQKQIDIWLK